MVRTPLLAAGFAFPLPPTAVVAEREAPSGCWVISGSGPPRARTSTSAKGSALLATLRVAGTARWLRAPPRWDPAQLERPVVALLMLLRCYVRVCSVWLGGTPCPFAVAALLRCYVDALLRCCVRVCSVWLGGTFPVAALLRCCVAALLHCCNAALGCTVVALPLTLRGCETCPATPRVLGCVVWGVGCATTPPTTNAGAVEADCHVLVPCGCGCEPSGPVCLSHTGEALHSERISPALPPRRL